MELFNHVLSIINNVIIITFSVAFGFQLIYIFLFFLKTKKYKISEKKHRIGVIVSARNESLVIQDVILSLQNQNYPKELFDFFIIADNCTDNTAMVARSLGAIVFERFDDDKNHHRVSYALKFGFEKILQEYDNYDFFIRFDADNVVDCNYLSKMNDCFSSGAKLAKGYNNAKNLTDNPISCISGLWYIRDNRFNCHVRSALRLSQLLNGPGMMVSADIIRKNGGWIDMGISEDADFTLSELLKGNDAEYVADAILYDDQPTTIKDTFRRNMRMGRGLIQTFFKYGLRCLLKFFKTFKFKYLDMFLTESFIPLALIAVIWFPLYYIYMVVFNGVTGNHEEMFIILDTLWKILVFAFIIPFIFQAILVYVLEYKRINTPFIKVLPGIILFPFFMILYALGITCGILFKAKWKPIKRSKAKYEIYDNKQGD
ncbi:glycosyltransferase family 2 protein [Acholeplasma sp. OttesenSCG-928-E16]|nr:glycosyltransferase family 2 protein [Acholeplasma sp. OttesenSCG-928-E16]